MRMTDYRRFIGETDWVVDGLVMVKYPKGDLVGMFFGYYSLLVYEIQAIYVTLFLWNRDLLTFYCCFTHLLSEMLTYGFKHYLKHPRPKHGAPGGGLFEGKYGMPSQHCHCFAYLITTMLLLVFHYYRQHIGSTKKALVLIISVVGLSLQIFGRIYLRFHTLNQCLVGVLVGCVSAFTFYYIGLSLIPQLEWVCNLKLMKFFHFRKDLLSQSSYPYSTRTIITQRTKINHCKFKDN